MLFSLSSVISKHFYWQIHVRYMLYSWCNFGMIRQFFAMCRRIKENNRLTPVKKNISLLRWMEMKWINNSADRFEIFFGGANVIFNYHIKMTGRYQTLQNLIICADAKMKKMYRTIFYINISNTGSLTVLCLHHIKDSPINLFLNQRTYINIDWNQHISADIDNTPWSLVKMCSFGNRFLRLSK